MDDFFRYDPAAYRAEVEHIAEHVVIDADALATVAPRVGEAESGAPPVEGGPRPIASGADAEPA